MSDAVTKKVALVVEDDIWQRLTLTDLLEDEEIAVIQCVSAEAAEGVLGDLGDKVSLLVTDINLAGVETGTELAFHAAAQFPDLRIIVVSANERPDLPTQAAFLRKPWHPLELMRAAIQ